MTKINIMSGIDKVKLMDSGTVLFSAENLERARERLEQILAKGGGQLRWQGERLLLDYSTPRYHQWIEARLEPTSTPGRFAASFREGNAGKIFRFDLPSKAALRRMDDILKALEALPATS